MNEHQNLEFYWEGLSAPKNGGGIEPDMNSKLGKMIQKCYGDMETIR